MQIYKDMLSFKTVLKRIRIAGIFSQLLLTSTLAEFLTVKIPSVKEYKRKKALKRHPASGAKLTL